mgnify:CR=1 FL=1
MTKDNAKELLLTLIYPRCEDDLTAEEKLILDEAAACQAEYGSGESVVGEKVGDVSAYIKRESKNDLPVLFLYYQPLCLA